MTVGIYFLVTLCWFASNNPVQPYEYSGGSGYNQRPNPAAGHRPQRGFGGGQQQGYNGGGQQQGYNGGGQWGNGFGQGGGHSQNRGGQQWQSGGSGAEAYKTNVFNEPDRYGYDYTIPGATVHYLMYKKKGNRGSGNHGVDNGWSY